VVCLRVKRRRVGAFGKLFFASQKKPKWKTGENVSPGRAAMPQTNLHPAKRVLKI
jgi:hypothetical protein